MNTAFTTSNNNGFRQDLDQLVQQKLVKDCTHDRNKCFSQN